MLPGCKGQCINLAGWHQKKLQQTNPIPAGIIDPKAEMYIPVWVNTLQRESVLSDDLVLKGASGVVLLRRCW